VNLVRGICDACTWSDMEGADWTLSRETTMTEIARPMEMTEVGSLQSNAGPDGRMLRDDELDVVAGGSTRMANADYCSSGIIAILIG
jgi:hypothetical protein